VHKAAESFRRCLSSLRAASPQPEEVIVVVDGDVPEAARLAEELGGRVVCTAARSGPAVARNLGARVARGDILLFIDADVSVHPTVIWEVLQTFQAWPEVSAVIGSYDDTPAAANFPSQYKNLLHHFVHQAAREEGYTFWGACGAIRREAFWEVGGFDERYRLPSIEDIELGYRLKAAGRRIRVCKTLLVCHHKRWGAVSLFRSDFFRRALPWTDLILRTGRLENDLNTDRATRLKVVLTGGLVVALALGFWRPEVWGAAALLAMALLILDAPLLGFFRRKRGTWFALRTIPWHWFYYFYSGLAVAITLVARLVRRGKPEPVLPAIQPVAAGSGLEAR
jgi:GT2 family glycosyltransferase